jgi:hypothetical protein
MRDNQLNPPEPAGTPQEWEGLADKRRAELKIRNLGYIIGGHREDWHTENMHSSILCQEMNLIHLIANHMIEELEGGSNAIRQREELNSQLYLLAATIKEQLKNDSRVEDWEL